MVVLLPVLALLLKLLYLGRRERHPLRPRRYAGHLVFAAHDLAFLFVVMIIAALVPSSAVRMALGAWVIAYGLWAMKVVYGGSWVGVLARAWFLGVSYVVLFALTTAALLVTAIVLR